MQVSEIALVIKAQAGDEQAFNELYQTYYARAMAVAFRFTNDYADAQDVVQEAFLQVHKSLQTLNQPEHFYSWLNQIIHSKSVNLFYHNRNEKVIDPNKIEKDKVYEEKRRYMLPQDEITYSSEQEILRKIIGQMDETYQVVLDLAYFRQMKLEEIAQFLDLPLGTVKTRVRRAKAELKNRIKAFEKEEGRHLSFNVDMILPSVIFSLSGLKSLLQQKSKAFFSVQAVHVVCIVSIVGLTLTGGIMTIQDRNRKQDQLPSTKQTSEIATDKEDIKQEVMETTVFGPYIYEDKVITTTREAYYICINWASTPEEMQLKDQTEIAEIKTIYEALKRANDQYYQMLKSKDWESIFLSMIDD